MHHLESAIPLVAASVNVYVEHFLFRWLLDSEHLYVLRPVEIVAKVAHPVREPDLVRLWVDDHRIPRARHSHRFDWQSAVVRPVESVGCKIHGDRPRTWWAVSRVEYFFDVTLCSCSFNRSLAAIGPKQPPVQWTINWLVQLIKQKLDTGKYTGFTLWSVGSDSILATASTWAQGDIQTIVARESHYGGGIDGFLMLSHKWWPHVWHRLSVNGMAD